MMSDQIPEPLSKPVPPASSTEPQSNVHPVAAGASSSTPLGTPPSNVGHPGRAKRFLSVLLFLILLGAAGAFGYLWYTNRQALNQANTDKTAAEQKLAEAEKKQKEAEAKVSPSPTPATKTDAEAITLAAKAYAPTNVNYKADTAVFGTPKISAKDKNFASVGIGEKGQTGGFSMILKKVDGNWIVILSGLQNTVLATDKAIYGIPTDMP